MKPIPWYVPSTTTLEVSFEAQQENYVDKGDVTLMDRPETLYKRATPTHEAKHITILTQLE